MKASVDKCVNNPVDKYVENGNVINRTHTLVWHIVISTALLRRFNQVFNIFLTEKDINLLILHRNEEMLITCRQC